VLLNTTVRECRVAYDEILAARVRDALGPDPVLDERKMFGGLSFTLHGNTVCGIVRDTFMLRLGEQLADQALRRPHVRPMDFTGRPMKSMVYVDSAGLNGRALRSWVEKATAHVRALPPKT
jgi:TfoX/Sxy family transcriptional regulator of competence genes